MKLVALAALLGLVGCDLKNLEQRRFCASANRDPAKCASRPDWCIPYGGPECVAAVEGAHCSECLPAKADAAPCSPKSSLGEDCSREAMQIKAGALNALSDHDRHMLCGPGSGADGTGRGPCVLQWNAQLEIAQCVLDPEFCQRWCTTRVRDFQCIAKNLCSGVICL